MPTYSPELNPIEKCFGMVKHYLRYHRTHLPLLEEILVGFSRITTEDVIKQYLSSAFYFLDHPFTLPPAFMDLLKNK